MASIARKISAARRGALAGLLMLAPLAGCGSRAAEEPSRHPGPPPARMAVAGGEVIVAGPKGFCIDRETSRDAGGGQALAVLSPCRELGAGLFAPRPAHPAVLTAAVAPAGPLLAIEDTAPHLAQFFGSERGRAALSRSGRAGTVAIGDGFAEGGVYFLNLTDSAPFSWGAVQPDYWRALLQAGGRMVTVAVLAPPEAPLARDEGLALLRAFVAAMRAATPEASG